MPRIPALCRSAASVRFILFAITVSGVRAFECAWSSRTSRVVQAMRLVSLCAILDAPVGWGLGGCHDRPRKLKKSPHLMRSSAGLPGASRVTTLRRLYHDDSAQLRCQLPSFEKAHSKRAARKPPLSSSCCHHVPGAALGAQSVAASPLRIESFFQVAGHFARRWAIANSAMDFSRPSFFGLVERPRKDTQLGVVLGDFSLIR